MSAVVLSVARDAARVVVVGVAVAVAAATLVVVLGVGEAVREWYGLTPDDPTSVSAGTLWLHNARALVPVFAAAAAVVWWPRARLALDVALSLLLALNVLLVAVALGAYGRRLWELGPSHYPMELLVIAAAAAAYLDGRRCGRLHVGAIALCAGLAAAALLVAAMLESAGAR
jgi:hypothetical protein